MTIKRIFFALTAISLFALGLSAQNMQSPQSFSNMHSKQLAKQDRVKDQIRVQEAQKYAADLYEECEPEPDIYTEGWDSDLVNCYKDANVPNSKVLDAHTMATVPSSVAPTRVLTCVLPSVTPSTRHSRAACASPVLSAVATVSM